MGARECRRRAGFSGAFYHGSTGWSPDDAVLPATSDVDVVVVLDEAELRTRPGKLRVQTPFFFASDISKDARAAVIDGSRELIEARDHREAVFWMVATYARCQKIFSHDAPPLQEKYATGFRELLGDLGISSLGDMRRRGAEVEAFLPRLWDVTEAIIAANPDVAE